MASHRWHFFRAGGVDLPESVRSTSVLGKHAPAYVPVVEATPVPVIPVAPVDPAATPLVP
jgi:hypothetical protein